MLIVVTKRFIDSKYFFLLFLQSVSTLQKVQCLLYQTDKI